MISIISDLILTLLKSLAKTILTLKIKQKIIKKAGLMIKKRIFLLYIFLIFSTYLTQNVIAYPYNSNFANYQHKLQVLSNKNNLKAEFLVLIANNDIKRKYGLMNIDKMNNKYGMIFTFNSERIINMWMKNTKISLDMIFIDKSNKIVNIKKSTQPMLTKIISSEILAMHVLEINANLADKYNIKVGDHINLIKKNANL